MTVDELHARVGGPDPRLLEAALDELVLELMIEAQQDQDAARYVLARVARRLRAAAKRRRRAERRAPEQPDVRRVRDVLLATMRSGGS